MSESQAKELANGCVESALELDDGYDRRVMWVENGQDSFIVLSTYGHGLTINDILR